MGLPLAVKRARNLAFRRTNLKLLAVSRKSVMGKKKDLATKVLRSLVKTFVVCIVL